MDICDQIKALRSQRDELDNKLKDLYKTKYGIQHDYEVEAAMKMEESIDRYGYGRPLGNEIKGDIPSLVNVYGYSSKNYTVRVIDINLISETNFKVVGYQEFEDKIYSIERLKDGIYRHKNGKDHVLVFKKTVNPDKFWVEMNLFEYSNQFLANHADAISKINALKEYRRKLLQREFVSNLTSVRS